MKHFLFSLAFAGVSILSTSAQTKKENIRVSIDLVNVKDDKVMVTVTPPKFSTDVVTYHIPKIIPGTYSEDDYGRFIEDIKAYDKKGKLLTVANKDVDSWTISNAKNISKDKAMIACGWLGKSSVLTITPIVATTIYNNTTYTGAMSAYPFCGRFYYNMRAML